MWLYLKENILKWHVLCAQYNKCTQIQDFPEVLQHLRKPVVTCSHWNAHVSSDELLLITLLWSTWSAGLGVILYLGGLQGAPQDVQEDGSLHFQIQTCSHSRQNQSPKQFNIIFHTSLKGYTNICTNWYVAFHLLVACPSTLAVVNPHLVAVCRTGRACIEKLVLKSEKENKSNFPKYLLVALGGFEFRERYWNQASQNIWQAEQHMYHCTVCSMNCERVQLFICLRRPVTPRDSDECSIEANDRLQPI